MTLTTTPSPAPSRGQPVGSWAEPLPADHGQALAVLDAIAGDRGAAMAMLRGDGRLGAELLPDVAPAAERVQLAQAGGAAGTMSDMPPMRLPPGAGALIRRGVPLVAAAELMRQVERSAERSQVEAAMRRFGLSRTVSADIMAARAYVWAQNFAPRIWWSVPYSGPDNDRVAQAVMRHERDNPGTLGRTGTSGLFFLRLTGDPTALAAINAVVAAAIAGTPLAGPMVLEKRRSAVADPALSTDSRVARRILGLQMGNQSWIAHHLIPFQEVANLLPDQQLAIAGSGWVVDSAENLIPLPRNYPTYVGPGNLRVLPWHAGSHREYSREVGRRLRPIAAQALTSPSAVRGLLRDLEDDLRDELEAMASVVR